jgi:ATP-binding cassette, subfamily B, bacterial
MSIARALLYDPKVLVLDEATSSVDTESEKAIQESLEVLTRGRTTLAIAHRLSTLRNSNRILVFDQGRLIEQGSHEELTRLDGTYARLVRIQTQVAGNRQFEAALNGVAVDVTGSEEESAAGPRDETADVGPRWLEADATRLQSGPRQALEAILPDGSVNRGVFAVQCFPASRPDEFISLRTWDRDGKEQELGIVRRLEDWSTEGQSLMRTALSRRYLLRRIEAIDDITLEHGYLNFHVHTHQGPCAFTMRWTQTQAQDFSARGKVLIDLEDNRFLVPDVDALPRRQRELFQRFVYW